MNKLPVKKETLFKFLAIFVVIVILYSNILIAEPIIISNINFLSGIESFVPIVKRLNHVIKEDDKTRALYEALLLSNEWKKNPKKTLHILNNEVGNFNEKHLSIYKFLKEAKPGRLTGKSA